MIKSGEYLTDICGIASAIDSFVNFPIWNGKFILKKNKVILVLKKIRLMRKDFL